MKYTAKERKVIADAYLSLCSLVGRYTGMEARLDDCVEKARKSAKERCNIRAYFLVMEAFMRGYKKGKSIDVSGLFGMSPWWIMACVTGAGYKKRSRKVSELDDYLKKLRTRTLKQYKAAIEAYDSAQSRWSTSLKFS